MVIFLSALLVIIACFQNIYSRSTDHPVVVLVRDIMCNKKTMYFLQYSGNDEVDQFSTAIKLSIPF